MLVIWCNTEISLNAFVFGGLRRKLSQVTKSTRWLRSKTEAVRTVRNYFVCANWIVVPLYNGVTYLFSFLFHSPPLLTILLASVSTALMSCCHVGTGGLSC